MRAPSIIVALSLGTVLALSSAVHASPDYVCKDNRVEKSSSTKFTVRRSGNDFAIEKNGSTVGNGVKRNDKIAVEINGSTKATIDNGKIEKNGSSWGTVAEAQRDFDCPGEIAATLWVLFKLGVLP